MFNRSVLLLRGMIEEFFGFLLDNCVYIRKSSYRCDSDIVNAGLLGSMMEVFKEKYALDTYTLLQDTPKLHRTKQYYIAPEMFTIPTEQRMADDDEPLEDGNGALQSDVLPEIQSTGGAIEDEDLDDVLQQAIERQDGGRALTTEELDTKTQEYNNHGTQGAGTIV